MNNFVFTEDFIWDESEEFMRLDRRTYGLPVDVYIDQGFTCMYNKHPLIIYFRNSYDPDEYNYVPIIVSERPYIPISKKINLYNKDVIKLKSWVKKYRSYIRGVSNGLINWKNLYKVAALNPRQSIVKLCHCLLV